MKSPIEYGQIPANRHARKQCLESESVHNGRRWREYFLSYSTAGYEPAGSMARWTEEYFSVTFEAGGATNGRRFKTEKEARNLFNKWIAQDKEDAIVSAEIARTEAIVEAGRRK